MGLKYGRVNSTFIYLVVKSLACGHYVMCACYDFLTYQFMVIIMTIYDGHFVGSYFFSYPNE